MKAQSCKELLYAADEQRLGILQSLLPCTERKHKDFVRILKSIRKEHGAKAEKAFHESVVCLLPLS